METTTLRKIQGEKIASLRKRLALSQEAFAARVGLASKGHVCNIESGKIGASVRVALEIERLSDGEIPASDLNPDVALVTQHIAANDTAPKSEAA